MTHASQKLVLKHGELCNRNGCCRMETPRWFEKTLECKHREKSLKATFVIELDVECILKKEHSCQNNFEKSYTKRKAMHEPSGWTIFTKC